MSMSALPWDMAQKVLGRISLTRIESKTTSPCFSKSTFTFIYHAKCKGVPENKEKQEKKPKTKPEIDTFLIQSNLPMARWQANHAFCSRPYPKAEYQKLTNTAELASPVLLPMSSKDYLGNHKSQEYSLEKDLWLFLQGDCSIYNSAHYLVVLPFRLVRSTNYNYMF